MTIRRTLAVLLLSSCAIFAFTPARADIGGVGSPVKPSNLPSPPPHHAAKPGEHPGEDENSTFSTENRTPLVVIRFKDHVYFGNVLREAVEATNKARPGAMYEVVSLVPVAANREQADRIDASAANNLYSVIQSLKNLGVPSAQIHSTTESSSTAAVQEIDIYVD